MYVVDATVSPDVHLMVGTETRVDPNTAALKSAIAAEREAEPRMLAVVSRTGGRMSEQEMGGDRVQRSRSWMPGRPT